MAAQDGWVLGVQAKEYLALLPDFYWYGFFGHWAVEIYAALQYAILHDGACPPLYKRPFYIVIRILFSICVAAPLPYFLGSTTISSAVYIGACAPLIMGRMATGSLGSKPREKGEVGEPG
jgi:hypothetical protein